MEPIFEAVLTGDDAVTRLLKKDASAVHARVSQDYLVAAIHWLYVGDTGLHLAAAATRTESARLLLAAGADPNARNRRGATPLHYSCDPRPASSTNWNPAQQAALIELLVRHGAHVDRGDRGGATALHRAVRARSVGAVEQLLVSGARTDCALKKSGSSPLHLAVQSTGAGGTAGSLGRQLEIIELLRRHGADPAAGDLFGRSPQEWAKNQRLRAALSVP